MKDMIQLMFMRLRHHEMTDECRNSPSPALCFRRVVRLYRLHERNLSGYDYDLDEYYGLSPDWYTTPQTAEETFIRYMYLILFPYLLLFGTIGNVLSIGVMRRYSHNVWSTCMYMMLLFPMDLITLYVECGNDWLLQIYDQRFNLSQEILLLSNAVCKVYTFTYTLLVHEAIWLTVAAGIETAISIRHPLWIYNMCTRERGSAIVLFITVMLISFNLHFFWTTGLTTPSDDPTISLRVCTYINELSDHFRDVIWPVINFLLAEAVPFVFLVTCLIISITKIQVEPNKAAELDRLLEQYFLDIKTLNELKKAMFIITVMSSVNLTCSILNTGILYFSQKEVLTMSYEGTILTNALLVVIKYICLSHKFWVFYFCCSKFREDVKGICNWLCRPLFNECFGSRNSGRILFQQNQSAAASWQEGDAEEENTRSNYKVKISHNQRYTPAV